LGDTCWKKNRRGFKSTKPEHWRHILWRKRWILCLLSS